MVSFDTWEFFPFDIGLSIFSFIAYAFGFIRASLVAHMVKCLPAML